MLKIDYDTWITTCEMVEKYSKKYGKFYIQLYPLNYSLDYFKQKEFYNKYIKNSAIFLDYNNYEKIDNCCLKQNGSFRNRYLITPIFYLYYTAIGVYIEKNYKNNLNENICVFYAGNFNELELHYRNSYNNFVKCILSQLGNYNYFYKLDVADYFNKIDLNLLNKKISNSMKFKQNEQLFLKEFLLFCGNGSFPQVECGTTSSYLATCVYFEQIDNNLYNFLKKENEIKDFKIIRYVDDLYILLNIDGRKNIDKIENKIGVFYQNLLYSHNLSINKEKSKLDKIENIYEHLKSFSIFSDSYDDKELPNEYKNYLLSFLTDLGNLASNKSITYKKYDELLKKYFESKDDIYYANQILYILIYKNISWLTNNKVLKKLKFIIENDFNILTLDPRRLVSMITNTHDESLIKSFLSNLYLVAENGKWNISYSYLAREYLLRRNFASTKLLNKMKIYNNIDVCFFRKYYKSDWRKKFQDDYLCNYVNNLDLINSPIVTLKFLEITSLINNDYIQAQSYNKSYFDAITKYIEIKLDPNCDKKNIFYRKDKLKKIYVDKLNISNEDWNIISDLCDIRNKNPLCHASLQIFNSKSDLSKKIEKDILQTNTLIDKIINNYF